MAVVVSMLLLLLDRAPVTLVAHAYLFSINRQKVEH